MCLHSSQVTKAMYARIQARDLLVVVGSGKAAIDILQGLQPSARVLWAHRGHTAFLNRAVTEAQFECDGEDLYRSLVSYAERGVMTKEHWSIPAFRDGWLISCHGQMTRRAVITGGGVCSLAELAHANGFSQMDLGEMYVSDGGELVLAPREGGNQSRVTIRANDSVIFCTGQCNNSFAMPTLSARFARSGPYTLNSGALTALVPLRVALEQICADETGSGGTEVACALQAERMCKASVAAVLVKPDEDPRGLEFSLATALLPVMRTVLSGVKVDVAYLKEWIGDWYGRDINVIDAMARLTGGGAKLSSRSQSGLTMGRVVNVEAATPLPLETVLALVARTAGGAVDADAMQLMEAARRIAVVARTRPPSRELAASREAATLIAGKELAASRHLSCTTADGGSAVKTAFAVETSCRILTEVTGSTVDPSTKYESLGLTSMQMVQFRDQLSEALGMEEIPNAALMTAEGRVDEVIGKLGLGSPAPEDEVAASAVPGHIEQITIAVGDGLEFSALAAGPMDGECVILLHGFPETSRMWLYQLEVLGRAGYRVVAPDQRGYSTGARPVGAEAYTMPLLCDDVLQIADALGATRFHLVGHDWGGAVAWHLAASHAERLLSLIVLSTPHPAAFAAALDDPLTGQTVASSYMRDLMRADSHETLLANGGSSLLAMFGLQRVARASKEAYLAVLTQPGALEAACNWYRANNPLDTADGFQEVSAVSVPTTFIWSTGDDAFTRAAG